MGSRSRQESGDPKGGNQGYYGGNNGADEMRLHAIRDEQARKKEQGLPSFQELERTPLTNGDDGTEDKYLVDEERTMPGGLRRDGSVLQGVGMGYGRRTPANAYAAPYAPGLSRRQSGSTLAGPGAAGVGAGGVGVEQPEPAYNYYDQGQQQDCECGGCGLGDITPSLLLTSSSRLRPWIYRSLCAAVTATELLGPVSARLL
jgi:hypothetical protein